MRFVSETFTPKPHKLGNARREDVGGLVTIEIIQIGVERRLG